MALRNALHAEVDSWKNSRGTFTNPTDLVTLWQRVFELEAVSRNSAATFGLDTVVAGSVKHKFVPLQTLLPSERQA